MIKGYECKLCDFKTTDRGYLNAQFQVEDHFMNNHKEENKRMKNSQLKQDMEIKKVKEKYPLITLADFLKSVESTPNKKWKCPRCGEEMSYGRDKYYHQANADRSGKPYKCIPLTNQSKEK